MADALALHREVKFDEAGALYDRIIEVYPEQPDALHLKGVVHMSNADERRPFTPSDEELMKVSTDSP